MAAMRLNLEADSLMEAILSFVLPPPRTTGRGGGEGGTQTGHWGQCPYLRGSSSWSRRHNPTNAKNWPNVVWTLGQRRRHWSNVKTTFGQCFAFARFFQELQLLTCVSWVTGRNVDFKKGWVKFVAFAVKVSPSAFDCTHCQPSFECIPHTDV